MTEEDRVKKIDGFIEEAKPLINKPYNSPLKNLWEDSVKRFLEEVYDEKMVSIFEESLSYGTIIEHGEGQYHHEEAMQRAIEFLEGLKSKQPPQLLHLQRNYENSYQKRPRPQQAPQNHYYNYGGNIHTGQGNIEQQISVGDIILKVSDEIQQKVPESQEKKSVLQALKTITTNETFANVTGTFIGSLLGKMVNPTGQ